MRGPTGAGWLWGLIVALLLLIAAVLVHWWALVLAGAALACVAVFALWLRFADARRRRALLARRTLNDSGGHVTVRRPQL